MTSRVALIGTLCLAGLPIGSHAEWLRETRDMMGTRVEIELWATDEAAARPLLAAGMREFERIEGWMSTYRETSEISAVNLGAAQSPVVVGPELYEIVEQALKLSELSNGAFDITFDSVGRLYDFRNRQRPDAGAIAANLPAIDYRHVVMNPQASTIRFTTSGTRINLGGIGKGYACEKVASLLRRSGVAHARVNAGGDTRFVGDRQGKPWVVGIRDPDTDDRWLTRLALDNEAVSTAGDYERFFDEGGVRYHHIIDPQTGESARGLRSVTVIGPDATLTDGLDNAVFVLGRERGLALIEDTPGYAAVLVDDQHNVIVSSQLRSR